ncbi:hypothetical protein EVG20_g1675 [Dentipellis fragilis]|uniref:Uncharacterized protein n=1 Tax=Dentipellis fragilis TaxID=205917 RepID=A0A4Y9Z966_9AGAM|nr:hypothetical protein EVG20_g1675 [Dentipellis fragilis]
MNKKKVVAKVDFNNIVNRPPRPVSPFKSQASQLSVTSEPPIRPKAKVNSSAVRKTSGSGSTIGVSARSPPPSSLPRPNSPFKSAQNQARDGPSSRPTPDTHVSKAKSTISSHPDAGSGSLHPNDLPPSPSSSSLSFSSNADRPSSPSPGAAIRVKAKISGLAKSSAPPSPLSDVHPASSPYATTRPIHHRTRAPSISSMSLLSAPSSPQVSPKPMAYPITTTVPAANPHRYAPPRPSPPTSNFSHLPAAAVDDETGVQYNARVVNATPKADPANIPLPPTSPPASTVSFSSRSSLSSASQNTQSSGFSRSTAPTLGSHVNGLGVIDRELDGSPNQRSALESLVGILDSDSGQDGASSPHSPLQGESRPDDPDRKIRAEAKSDRKIKDLEITNRSLLAINSSLEATKHRQAKEIRELRRKLRESRLILPPREFRAVKSSLPAADLADDEDDEDEDEEEEEITEESFAKQDDTYRRVKCIIDGLLESGRAALTATPDDFREGGKAGTKVLNPEELRTWNGADDTSEARSIMLPSDADSDDELGTREGSRSFIGDESFRSEDEVEEMMSVPEVDPAFLPPPITVTLS